MITGTTLPEDVVLTNPGNTQQHAYLRCNRSFETYGIFIHLSGNIHIVV